MKESNKLSTKQVSKARATPKQSYLEIMQELGIPVYCLESTQKCHYNLVNDRKEGIKLKNLSKLAIPKSCICFLRYQDGYFNFQLQQKNGGYT
jgi:hypothetical protein